MFRNSKLSTKIVAGFFVMLIIMLAFGIFVAIKCSFLVGMSKSVSGFAVPQAKMFGEMQNSFLKAMYNYRLFIATSDKTFEKNAKHHLQEASSWIIEGRNLANKLSLSDREKLNSSLNAVSGMLKDYENEALKALEAGKELYEAREQMESAGLTFTRSCNELLKYLSDYLDSMLDKGTAERKLKAQMDAVVKILADGSLLQILVLQSQIENNREMLLKSKQYFEEIKNYLKNINEGSVDPEVTKFTEEIKKAVKIYEDAFKTLENTWSVMQDVQAKQVKVGEEILNLAKTNSLHAMDNAQDKASLTASELVGLRYVTVVALIVALILGIVLALVITASISRPIKKATEELSEASIQVETASREVSSSSQSLAEVASEQAAALEQISSSVEELSSMTKQNANNAKQADSYMKEAHKIVEEANNMMNTLASYMNEISATSEETFKIIKTIDEIAFQTNLLALNAAVEAARAGEAGAGFAVVADEVRALALRAAEAARNTAALIEETVNKIRQGTQLTTTTHDSFTKVTEAISRVAQLMDEISAASNEQAEGIEQINKAIGEMDKAVQQTAASAEESAAASEELNAQANQMKSLVDHLVSLVGSAGSGLTTREALGEAKIEQKPLLISHSEEEFRQLPRGEQ
ncbi:methyl-accepting chemotaxis protein [Thermodesulforhabdus norvegica]|uniref:Methyl-accepting chemotaxis protein n=1 Tax=Thermodesulforhabdus norvegica TaxID=39841 RepID=A0A1I4QJ68_9BACT|nr:methyl-accepting chemotaxis protein [Thermodesulforhabdus norvegica]SFM39745.1 methyl-accepting chemotaxis protein [Thermodesulforhabdus norvegica]